MNTIKQKDYNEKKSKVFISFVLDESSSMMNGRESIISGMNEQIQTLKDKFKDGIVEPVISFVKFSDNVVPLYEGRTIDDLKQFEKGSYNPQGSTALYDAVGYTIDMMAKLDGIDDELNSCLLIVVTDGEENTSKKYNSSLISEKILTLNKTGRWTVTYLGPNNVDLTKVNKSTNISYGNMYACDLTTAGGYGIAFSGMNVGLNNWVTCASNAISSGAFFSTQDFYVDSSNTKDSSAVTLASVNSK